MAQRPARRIASHGLLPRGLHPSPSIQPLYSLQQKPAARICQAPIQRPGKSTRLPLTWLSPCKMERFLLLTGTAEIITAGRPWRLKPRSLSGGFFCSITGWLHENQVFRLFVPSPQKQVHSGRSPLDRSGKPIPWKDERNNRGDHEAPHRQGYNRLPQMRGSATGLSVALNTGFFRSCCIGFIVKARRSKNVEKALTSSHGAIFSIFRKQTFYQ